LKKKEEEDQEDGVSFCFFVSESERVGVVGG